MKRFLILAVCFCMCKSEANPEVSKTTSVNSIQSTSKPEQVYYQTIPTTHVQPQPQTQYVPVQFIPKPVYYPQTHSQPTTMLIIAQPALLPQHMLYNQGGQLGSYYQPTAQPRYQILQQYQPHPTVQPYYPQVASTMGAYQYLPAPQYYSAASQVVPQQATPAQHLTAGPQYITAPQYTLPQASHYSLGQLQSAPLQLAQYGNQLSSGSHASSQVSNQLPSHLGGQGSQHLGNLGGQLLGHLGGQSGQYGHSASSLGGSQIQPMQLSAISQLAQLTANKFASGQAQAAPIVTGLELFTPEQQAQIKAQLSSHLGSGTPLTPITSNSLANALPTSSSGLTQSTTASSQEEQFGAKYTAQPEYSGAQEEKGGSQPSSSFTPSVPYRSQYTKG